MIKSNEGEVNIDGTRAELMGDFGVIVVSLLRATITKDDIKEIMETAFEVHEKDFKEVD